MTCKCEVGRRWEHHKNKIEKKFAETGLRNQGK